MLRWIGAAIGFFTFERGAVLAGFIAGYILELMIKGIRIIAAEPWWKKRPPVEKPWEEHPSIEWHIFTLAVAVIKQCVFRTQSVRCIQQFFNEKFGYAGDKFLAEHLGGGNEEERLDVIRRLAKREIPLEPSCNKLRESMDEEERFQVLHFLFSVARATGPILDSDLDFLKKITLLAGMTTDTFYTLLREFCKGREGPYSDSNNRRNTRDDNRSTGQAYYNGSASAAYALLGIHPTATDEEVKKAYRLAAKNYHPDKFNHKGEAAIADAAKKFIAINDAYEKIKQDRGL
ncbi:MAG: DnaJ domain-containing protein [Odoribacteraceae bacterium]|jgi:DnaJ-domain-containing protein 1|nr:DnaJ domain-containing protein [Odoribacteraceae bacterium]